MMKHLCTFAVLLGLAGLNAGLYLMATSDTPTFEYAKATKTPVPDPDHGPTLPPHPWPPI